MAAKGEGFVYDVRSTIYHRDQIDFYYYEAIADPDIYDEIKVLRVSGIETELNIPRLLKIEYMSVKRFNAMKLKDTRLDGEDFLNLFGRERKIKIN
jgi:hypothetical protein